MKGKISLLLKNKTFLKKLIILVIVLFVVAYIAFAMIILPKYQFSVFKKTYEESLVEVFEENSWELIYVEYPEIIPDKHKEYYETERINEYNVYVYLKGEPLDGKEMYDSFLEIRGNNDYLLSNTYKILSSGAYIGDDCKETGFHEVNTILVFEDQSEYKRDYISVLKNDKVIYKRNLTQSSSSSYWYSGECGYPECDHNKAKGKPYCHQHACGEAGCQNPTDLLPSYCDEHNCTYGSCTAPRYTAANSTYCQRHYIETY